MNLAVIGKGTAGSIASAYLSKHLPKATIDLYFSEDIGTIGVGEGGGPRLTNFLDDLRIDHHEFSIKTQATKKWGILFENWGSKPNQSIHHFNPPREKYSYHFDANELHDLLIERSKINIHKGHVQSIQKANGEMLKPFIVFNDEKKHYDYIIDASGFTKTPLIKTRGNSDVTSNEPLLLANQAYLVQIEHRLTRALQYNIGEYTYDSLTLSKALEHGWLFVIPLKTRVSFGYIHNDKMSSLDLIKEQLYSEIHKLDPSFVTISERVLKFNSFTTAKFLDQSVFSIGNRAAFAEPLEATAIEFILRECAEIRLLLSSDSLYSGLSPLSQQITFNNRLTHEMQRIALFIGWHYSNGSIYNSEFWRLSRIHYHHMKNSIIDKRIVSEFDRWLQTLTYTQACPHTPFFGWSFRSFEEVSSAIA